MRGSRLGRSGENLTGERGILAAVLLNALKAAERGEPEAVTWLDERGCFLLELLGIEVSDWRAAVNMSAGLSLSGKQRRAPLTNAERSRRAYWRRKNASGGLQEDRSKAKAA